MKHKGAFVLDHQQRDYVEGQFFQIYSDEVLDKLCNLLDISLENIDIHELDKHRDKLKDVEYLFTWWGMGPVPEQEIRTYLPALKAVFYAGGRTDVFDAPFIACGIPVISAIDVHAIPVAEFTVAEILLANKGMFLSRELVRTQGYAAGREFAKHYEGNLNSCVGILGLGHVGSMVAQRLQAYDVEVLACDPNLTAERAAALGVRRVSMEELFSNSNVITCHLGNTPDTVKLVDMEYLSLMADYSTIINNGNGQHINEADLYRVLAKNPTITAFIDHEEAQYEDVYGLLLLPNVFRTPLIAGSMGNEVARMGDYVYRQCEKMLRTEKQ